MNLIRILAQFVIITSLMLGSLHPAFAQVQDTESVPYTFKTGDTLNGFASKYLVSIEAAQTVQKINGTKDATKIRPGTILKVPTSLLKGTPIGANVDYR